MNRYFLLGEDVLLARSEVDLGVYLMLDGRNLPSEMGPRAIQFAQTDGLHELTAVEAEKVLGRSVEGLQ